jgi:hypothetical protein
LYFGESLDDIFLGSGSLQLPHQVAGEVLDESVDLRNSDATMLSKTSKINQLYK